VLLLTILGIAAEKLFGEAGRGRFDPWTVAMAHPDATVYLLSGGGELTTHFSAPPYQYQALKAAGVREILNSTEVMGGPATITVVFGMTKFYEANPKIIAAINAALAEAMELIDKDKRTAAESYLKVSKEKLTVEELVEMINKPRLRLHDGSQRRHEIRRADVQDRGHKDQAGELEGPLLSIRSRTAGQLVCPTFQQSRCMPRIAWLVFRFDRFGVGFKYAHYFAMTPRSAPRPAIGAVSSR
jgi:hypothetical protein